MRPKNSVTGYGVHPQILASVNWRLRSPSPYRSWREIHSAHRGYRPETVQSRCAELAFPRPTLLTVGTLSTCDDLVKKPQVCHKQRGSPALHFLGCGDAALRYLGLDWEFWGRLRNHQIDPTQVLTKRKRWKVDMFPKADGDAEILRAKPRVLPYPGERGRADFFAVVKAECKVGPARALQLSMGPNLLLERPTDPQQGRMHPLCLSPDFSQSGGVAIRVCIRARL